MKSFFIPAIVTGSTLAVLPHISAFNASPTSSSSRTTALGYQGAPPLVDSATVTPPKSPKIALVNWKDEVSSFSTAASTPKNAGPDNQTKRRRSKVHRDTTSTVSPSKELSELSLGDWITARVAVVTPQVGAFVQTDYKLSTNRGYALLPKSQMKANRETVNSNALPVHAGQDVRVRVIALDQAKGEIAVSMLPEQVSLDNVLVGESRQGIVRAIRPYGAFVDVGCQTNGLLHKSRMVPAVPRHEMPNLTLGQAIEVRVIGKDLAKQTMEVSMLDSETDANIDARIGIQRRRAEV